MDETLRFTINHMYTFHAENNGVFTEGVYTDENEKYIIEKYKILNNHPFIYRLAIKRHDNTVFHSWSLFQNIKNQIIGEDYVAIELYPAQSKVTDTANIYHLWVFKLGYSPNVALI